MHRQKSLLILMYILPVVLIIPNIILDITEDCSLPAKIVNILLPGGLYILLASCSRKIAQSVLCSIPIMIYAGFQIVLIYLYGESIIAVDMFLNVVTTSVSEATELLRNLTLAIITVCLLYVVPIIWAITLIIRKAEADPVKIRVFRRAGLWTTLAGIATLGISLIFDSSFNAIRDIFPVNVIDNTITAIKRTVATRHYFETSADFNYNATSRHHEDTKEIYILIIGETSRADNWQLFGYEKETNPCLSKRNDLIIFPKTLSQSNTTHKSVPLMLTPVSAENFGDSIYMAKSVITAFNQVGYRTAFISNQSHNHSFTDFFSQEANTVKFINEDGRAHYDDEMLTPLTDILADTVPGKTFIIMHTYGSHFNYKDRYRQDDAHFIPDDALYADIHNRDILMNAYDNTIRFTDSFIDRIISAVDSLECPAAIMYLSDHGEDIYDDSRERFLHASPVPTYYQIHVPLLLWMSPEYREQYPDAYTAAISNRNLDIASNRIVFDTLLQLAGISSQYTDSSKSIISTEYRCGARTYLNDYNESIPLEDAGLRHFDYEQLAQKGISAK